MNMLWQTLKKDFLRLRWGWAVWLVAIAGKLALAFYLVFSDDLRWRNPQELLGLSPAFPFFEALCVFWLTAIQVQSDSLIGTGVFWRTRPISGGRLLGLKFLSWLALFWLPAVGLNLVWWIFCGFGPRQIAHGALEQLALNLAAALPAALIAVFTDSFSRFVVWAFVLLFACVSVGAIVSAGWHPGVADAELGVLALFWWLGLALLSVVVVACRYFRRDLRSSLVLLTGGSVVVVALALGVTPRWASSVQSWNQIKSTDWQPERAKEITLNFAGARSWARSKPDAEAWLMTSFELQNIPTGRLVLASDFGTQEWRWPDGLQVRRGTAWTNSPASTRLAALTFGLPARPEDPETAEYNRQREIARIEKFRKTKGTAQQQVSDEYIAGQERRLQALLAPPRPRIERGPTVELAASVLSTTIQRVQRTPPSYSGDVHLRLLKPEIRHEFLLRETPWQSRNGHGLRISEARLRTTTDRIDQSRRDSMSVAFTQTRPRFLTDEFTAARTYLDDLNMTPVFILNRRSGDWHFDWASRYPTMVISGVAIRRAVMTAGLPRVRRGDEWQLRDQDWAAQATLAVVEFVEEARLTRHVEVSRYDLRRDGETPR